MQAKDIKLTNNSKVKTFKLVTQIARPGKIFVGSKETNSYLIIDDYWFFFIELLAQSFSLLQISQRLTQKDPKNFDAARSLSKVKMMTIYFIKHRLVKQIDRDLIYKTKSRNNINSAIQKPLFIAIIPVLIFAVLSLLFLPRYFPKPEDFFWSTYYSLCVLSSFVFTWITALLHESAHLLIARAFNIKGKLRLSHRLNYLVVETYFPDIYSLPKNARIVIYISGIVTDMALISFLYGITFTHNYPLVRQFILLEWLSILWQFFFFMKTDMYFVIKELIGIENLYTYANQKIANLFKFKKMKLLLNKREDRLVNIYSVFVVIGTLIALFRYGFYHIPILATLIIGSIQKIITGVSYNHTIILLDGLIVLTIEVLLNLLLIFTLLRRNR